MTTNNNTPGLVEEMTLVFQTQFGEGNGDCFAACIATILGIPLEHVPNFCAIQPPDDWWEETQKWLAKRGLGVIEFKITDDKGEWYPRISQLFFSIPCIFSGKSPRGNFQHSVVGKVGRIGLMMTHDPHPDAKFLDGNPREVLFIVPLRAALAASRAAPSQDVTIEALTIEQIEKMFEDTIFYNWGRPVREGLLDPQHRDCESELEIVPSGDEGRQKLVFQSGEIDMTIAEVFSEKDTGQDPEGHLLVGGGDAEFIAHLPVIVPILLRRIYALSAAAPPICNGNGGTK